MVCRDRCRDYRALLIVTIILFSFTIIKNSNDMRLQSKRVIRVGYGVVVGEKGKKNIVNT